MAENKKRKPKHRRPAPGKQRPKATKEPVNEEVVLCTDIEVLPFSKFLTCMCQSDYTVLRVKGKPTPNQLYYAWITVLSEYYTLINDREQERYIRMAAKMEMLNLKITAVKALCAHLKLWYDAKLCNVLKKFGYNLSYSPDTLLEDIERTLIELSNDEFKLTKMRIDYERENKHKKKTGQAPKKNDYMKILYAIEKHRAQRYPADKITVYEFGMWLNELVEYGEAMKEAQDRAEYNKKKKK